MALDDYARKRNFQTTPEPVGNQAHTRRARQGQPRFFCVQKHLASHLHCDFRLEHDGVLLSWAVPKGPSLDPAVRRLAMHVEDHPFEYGTFEGVIPEGYGAGLVMLWDTGTWTPEVDDIGAALEKGDLKFHLDGVKLKGSWALVRTRGYGGRGDDGRSWLLIKHRDDWAGDVDVAAFAPLSVKSGYDFAEILAAHEPDIWRSNQPARGGETGRMLRAIIEDAARIKSARPRTAPATSARPRTAPATSARPRTAPATSARPRTAPASPRRTKGAGADAPKQQPKKSATRRQAAKR